MVHREGEIYVELLRCALCNLPDCGDLWLSPSPYSAVRSDSALCFLLLRFYNINADLVVGSIAGSLKAPVESSSSRRLRAKQIEAVSLRGWPERSRAVVLSRGWQLCTWPGSTSAPQPALPNTPLRLRRGAALNWHLRPGDERGQ